MGEVAHRAHDRGHPVHAVLGACDGSRHTRAQVIEVGAVLGLADTVDQLARHGAAVGRDEQLLIDVEQVDEVPEGVAEEADGVADELRRRVDLVRDSRRQLPDRVELLCEAQVDLEPVALCLGALGGGDVEQDALQQAAISVLHDGAGGMQPDELAVGPHDAKLGRGRPRSFAQHANRIDDPRPIFGVHQLPHAIHAAHPLIHRQANDLLDPWADVDRTCGLAVGKLDDVDDARDLLDELLVQPGGRAHPSSSSLITSSGSRR
jgi:hypothetical protein